LSLSAKLIAIRGFAEALWEQIRGTWINIWEYRTHAAFSKAERAGIGTLCLGGASQVPNANESKKIKGRSCTSIGMKGEIVEMLGAFIPYSLFLKSVKRLPWVTTWKSVVLWKALKPIFEKMWLGKKAKTLFSKQIFLQFSILAEGNLDSRNK